MCQLSCRIPIIRASSANMRRFLHGMLGGTPAYLIVVGLLLGITTALADSPPDRYPKRAWPRVDPAVLGWSPEKLAAAQSFIETLPPASVVVIDHGCEVAEWGDAAKKIKISSMRK